MTATAVRPVFDVDSHVVEPPDLWTSRLRGRFAEHAPRVVWDPDGGEHRWQVGGLLLSAVGEYCSAGWPEAFPSHPPTLEQAEAGCWEPLARLARLDELGVQAQVLYPNVMGFDAHAFLDQLGPEGATACVQAYNDFVAEFADHDRQRLVPIMMLPFWDVEASCAEMRRAAALGHRGILFGALLHRIGLPRVADPCWTPLFALAEQLGLSVNLHVGFTVREGASSAAGWSVRTKQALAQRTDRVSFVRRTALDLTSNIEAAVDVIFSGLLERFPELRFVSVESGFGYWPYILDHIDWFWVSSGAREEHPDRPMPSDIWRRHFYCTAWFERATLPLVGAFADNLMLESDYPHETSLPAVVGEVGGYLEAGLEAAGIDPDVRHKVCWGNAAALYGVEGPTEVARRT